MTWETRYVFVHDYELHDELILRIGTYLQKLTHAENLQKWFFLRYWEGGPHIRLRWLAERDVQPDDEILTMVRQFLAEHPPLVRLTKEKYYQNHKFDGSPLEHHALPWYEHGQMVSADYEPEYDRYGGQALMPLTEHLFMVSSRYALDVILATRSNPSSIRLIYALAILKRLSGEVWEQGMLEIELSEFYHNCMQSWVRLYSIQDLQYADILLNKCRRQAASIRNIVACLSTDASYLSFQDGLLAGLDQIMNAVHDNKKFRSILFSHLHMFLNRLGVAPEYECAVYYILRELGGELHDGAHIRKSSGAI